MFPVFSFKTIKIAIESFLSPNFNDFFPLQQKAKETPKKAKQPTETFNLSLRWRCRHVNHNLSCHNQSQLSTFAVDIQRPQSYSNWMD